MAKDTSIDRAHEDGSWFLEAVGAKERSPSPIESIAELERENTITDLPAVVAAPSAVATVEAETVDNEDTSEPAKLEGDPEAIDEPSEPAQPVEDRPNNVIIEMTSFDGDPGTSLSMFDPVPELPPLPSNVATAIPRKKRYETDILEQPVDEDDISHALKTRRPFRWPALAALLAVFVVVAIVALWLPRAADNAAAATQQSYYDASLQVRTYLPTAQASLDIATSPSSTDGALGSVIPVVSELTSYATELATVAAEPLPSTLPLVSSDALDALPPLQDRSAMLASDSSEVARQIGHAYVYRTSIPKLLDVGDLPTSASTDEINALSVDLASSLAENASLIADLPPNPAFDGLVESATQAVGAYAQWQEDYLGALSDGDAATAETLIAEITATRDGLNADLQDTLLSFREDLDGRIVSLSSAFDDHLANLTP